MMHGAYVTQNYNFACCCKRTRNFVSHMNEKRSPRVFEIKVLRKIFGPNRAEITAERRRLHNEELHELYSSINTVGVIN